MVPEANLMIERDFNLEGDANKIFSSEDEINETIFRLLTRAESYVKQAHLRTEGQMFVLEGLLPYIYKYMSCLLNLTSFEIKSRGMNPYSNTVRVLDTNDLLCNIETARELYRHYKNKHAAISDILSKNINHTLYDGFELSQNPINDSITEDGKKIREQDAMMKSTISNIESTKANVKGQEQIEKLTEKLIQMCTKVMTDIEKFYEGSTSKEQINQFKHID